MATTVDDVMVDAQTFASAWSLVGRQFDNGQMLGEAQAAKAEIRAAILAYGKAQRDRCAAKCASRDMGDGSREDQEARRCEAAIRALGDE